MQRSSRPQESPNVRAGHMDVVGHRTVPNANSGTRHPSPHPAHASKLEVDGAGYRTVDYKGPKMMIIGNTIGGPEKQRGMDRKSKKLNELMAAKRSATEN